MKPTPEKIYLFEMGCDEIVWCDEPAPDEEGDAAESVEYIRADCAPCENQCEAMALKAEIRRLKARLAALPGE